jgi:hypothetical protein
MAPHTDTQVLTFMPFPQCCLVTVSSTQSSVLKISVLSLLRYFQSELKTQDLVFEKALKFVFPFLSHYFCQNSDLTLHDFKCWNDHNLVSPSPLYFLLHQSFILLLHFFFNTSSCWQQSWNFSACNPGLSTIKTWPYPPYLFSFISPFAHNTNPTLHSPNTQTICSLEMPRSALPHFAVSSFNDLLLTFISTEKILSQCRTRSQYVRR